MPGLKSIFSKPSEGVITGLAEGVVIALIYNMQMPSGADVRMGPANESNLEATRKSAAYLSAGVLGLVFVLTRDFNAFIIGGLELGGIDYLYKHHNAVNQGGKWSNQNGGQNIAPSNVYSLPDYSAAESG
jgi:hypothetical protein